VIAGTLLGAISAIGGWRGGCSDPTVQALRAIRRSPGCRSSSCGSAIFETSKVVLIAAGVFFPIYLGVMGAILSVDRKIVEVAAPSASPDRR